MQNTDEKTKSKPKNKLKAIALSAVSLTILAAVLLVSFGGSLGIPNWNDVFSFCTISADIDSGISLSFVNVGSADACYIKCGDKNVLVDTGTSLSYEKLSSYFKRCGCSHFDAIVISHPDSDHIGAAADIIKDFGTDALYMYPLSESLKPKTAEYKALDNSINEYNVDVVVPQIQSDVKIGDMNFKFISPLKEYSTANDSSLAFMLTYRDKRFMFTGDMSGDVEADLLNSDTELKCDVLKVAHHGSKTSSSEEFLMAASPEISIVSVGESDSRLPDYYTMALINSYSKVMYTTADDKTIVITSDGSSLSVKTHA